MSQSIQIMRKISIVEYVRLLGFWLFCFIEINCVTNFNYLYNGKFDKHNCTAGQLTGYACTIPVNSSEFYYYWECDYLTSCYNLQVESETNFMTSLTGIVVVPLDYYSGPGTYIKRGIEQFMFPIYGGSYKLSLTAMTRKTGNPSDYTFTISVFDTGKVNYYLNAKTYTFSTLGTINVEQIFTITNVNQSTLYLQIVPQLPLNTFGSPIGAGITNVKFEKLLCGSNQTLTFLSNGESACIENALIQSVNYCSKFTYYHHFYNGGTYHIYKTFSCEECSSPYQLVGFQDDHLYAYEWLRKKYGCALFTIPNNLWYYKSWAQNSLGNWYYTGYVCSTAYWQCYLIVPGIAFPNYDQSSCACVQPSPSVVYWQIANGSYVPGVCVAGYYPVIKNDTSRVCQIVAAQYLVESCAIYTIGYQCYACVGNTYTTLSTWNNSGTYSKVCVSAYQRIFGCKTYINSSSTYICNECEDDNTLLTNSNGTKICVRTDHLDSQCMTYSLNTKNNYDCTVCNSNWNLVTINIANYIVHKCFSGTQIIRDCAIYQSFSGAYQCYQCSNTTNIAKYFFVLQSFGSFKCLNTVSEYIEHCTTYSLISQIYGCTGCDDGYSTKTVTINLANRTFCLDSATQVVPNCNLYEISGSSYECISCDSTFNLKPISGVNKCLPDIVMDPNCASYVLNGNNFECGQCQQGYGLSDAYVSSAIYKRCIQSSKAIRDCSVYEDIQGNWQCHQCSSSANIGKYEFILDGIQSVRCLDTVSEYVGNCKIYNFSIIYWCRECDTNYQMHSITIDSTVRTRCLSITTQTEAHCDSYALNSSNKYVCTVCSSQFTLQLVSSVPKCLPNSLIDSECTTYILNGSKYECSACTSEYVVMKYYNENSNSFEKKCLLTTSQIRDCSIYQSNSNGYECHSCTSGSGLSRLIVSVHGVTSYRCLNTTKEYSVHCETYDIIDGSYVCKLCNSDFTKINVSLSTLEVKIDCILNTVAALDCILYQIDTQSNYVCTHCIDGFTPTSLYQNTLPIECIDNDAIDSNCQMYTPQEDNYLCLQCGSSSQIFIIQKVTVAGKLVNKCLNFDTELINYCEIYEFDSLKYRCKVCQSQPNIQGYFVKLNGQNQLVCLNKSIEYVEFCTDYEYSQGMYQCLTCQYGYLKVPTLVQTFMLKRCILANQATENCSSYNATGSPQSYEYICLSCQTGYIFSNSKVCVKNENQLPFCNQYVDEGEKQKCTACASGYLLSNVTENNQLILRCLRRDYQAIRGCKIYQQISYSLQCNECEPDYTKETVIIHTQGEFRCLNQTQVEDDCKIYLLDTDGKYVCDECNEGWALKVGADGKICIQNINLTPECVQYQDDGIIQQCTLCSLTHTLSAIQLNSVTSFICLSNTLQVIPHCKTYIKQSSSLKCIQCLTGTSLGNLIVNSVTHAKCLVSSEVVQNCEFYGLNSTSHYFCSQCASDYTLEDSPFNHKNICVNNAHLLPNCIQYKLRGSIQECTKCQSSFTLTKFTENNLQSILCLSNSLALEYCKSHEKLVLGDLQCLQCKTGYQVGTVQISETKLLKRCIQDEDVVDSCKTYIEIPHSCVHLCNSCYPGARLATTRVPHKIFKACLDEITEYLPFCNLHSNERGVYFCRHGVCQIGYFAIQIGSDPSELACANQDLIQSVEMSRCEYFQRPFQGATQIKCLKCKDAVNYPEPYCKETYQGLTNGP